MSYMDQEKIGNLEFIIALIGIGLLLTAIIGFLWLLMT
jgi:hypothetical protein